MYNITRYYYNLFSKQVRDRLRYALEANTKLEEKLESTMQEVLIFLLFSN